MSIFFLMAIINYLEKPVTVDEKMLVDLLHKNINALETSNLGLLASLYDDEAFIETFRKRNKLLDKKEYIKAMFKTSDKVRKMNYSNVLIRVNGNEASISYIWTVFLYGLAKPTVAERYLKCKKKNDLWYIVEAKYLSRSLV